MSLRRVQVTTFRCLHAADLDIDPGFTLISGPNASGKTSLLEAIYVLGRGHSFRARQPDKLIQRGAERFVVYGDVEHALRRVGMGIEGAAGTTRVQIAGSKPSSRAELARQLPVQIIDPEVHRLIEEGPYRRRRFLDWGTFHGKQSFVGHWQRYNQVLKQRNAALRLRHPRGAVLAWDTELVRYGELVSDARRAYVDHMQPVAAEVVRRLLGAALTLTYRSGWNRDMTLGEALVRGWPVDADSGSTQVGPHRAELAIRVDGIPARDHVSRGQQKLLAAGLLLSQLQLFPVEGQIQPTLLLDDPAAELDSGHLGALIDEVRAHPVQLIVTTLQRDFGAFGSPGRRFALERGVVRPA